MKSPHFSSALLDASYALPEGITSLFGSDINARFGVYRNNVMVSLIKVLEDNFPVVATLVGEDFFRAMAKAFALATPPRSPVMNEYGDQFAQFILNFAPAVSVPYLADMARLEWQCLVASEAADISAVNLESVNALIARPDTLAASLWQFHPSVALLDAQYAIASLWLAHQHESDLEVAQALAQVNPDQAETALILRHDLNIVVKSLQVGERIFIQALMGAQCLGVALEMAMSKDQNFDFIALMGDLLGQGAFISYLQNGVLQ
jgi:hypothetical protein